jgi:hypothetical protein
VIVRPHDRRNCGAVAVTGALDAAVAPQLRSGARSAVLWSAVLWSAVLWSAVLWSAVLWSAVLHRDAVMLRFQYANHD